MKNITLEKIITLAIIFTPLVTIAATLGDRITAWTSGVFLIINFLMVLATLVFLWGIVKYVSAGGDAAKVKEARSYILWGIIGLAIMGSVWVVVRFIQLEVTGETGTGTFPQYQKP